MPLKSYRIFGGAKKIAPKHAVELQPKRTLHLPSPPRLARADSNNSFMLNGGLNREMGFDLLADSLAHTLASSPELLDDHLNGDRPSLRSADSSMVSSGLSVKESYGSYSPPSTTEYDYAAESDYDDYDYGYEHDYDYDDYAIFTWETAAAVPVTMSNPGTPRMISISLNGTPSESSHTSRPSQVSNISSSSSDSAGDNTWFSTNEDSRPSTGRSSVSTMSNSYGFKNSSSIEYFVGAYAASLSKDTTPSRPQSVYEGCYGVDDATRDQRARKSSRHELQDKNLGTLPKRGSIAEALDLTAFSDRPFARYRPAVAA